MIETKKTLREYVYAILKDNYPLELNDVEMSTTPNIKMGDLAMAFPFQLAKKMQRSPRELAQEIVPQLMSLPNVQKTEVAGGGFINLFLNKEQFLIRCLQSLEKTSLSREETKIIIEHTNINPNKAAHIGHLRNACLGDVLGHCQKFKGEKVEIQNYIDDTGVQVVDVVFGFMEIEKKGLAEIRDIGGKFDYYCWDLYTRVSSYLEANPQSQKRRSQILKHVEEGINPEAEIGNHISRRIISAHLRTMRRLGIGYDVLPCESTILALKFWEKAFSLLKEKEAIAYVDEGENKGCWVMKLDSEADREKIIVRSDGTVTYVGKDIAYQLWKFGLLEIDFFYRPFEKEGEKTIWITTAVPSKDTPTFGSGSLVYNVIDTRQSYLQQIVVQGLRSLHFLKQAEKSIHFSYEMVALSPRSLEELDLEIAEEDKKKNFLEVSGRKGLGVKADDLLDRLEEKALSEVEKRNQDLPSDQKEDIAHKIAVGALRYFMLKYARNSLIIFDFEDALSFEGETGPYLQYTSVRINSIFRKLEEREGRGEENVRAIVGKPISLSILSDEELLDFWEIILYASQLDEEVLHTIRSLETSHLAKFAFNLCQKFNAYYHKYSILSEKDHGVQNIRILAIFYIREVLKQVLSLMGIPLPERM
ncbi:MAG: arginine--tRNA ligase [Candidatus Aminicenantes bacterium]|nr:arginine--tRNA ligase [Candidatus Aminicenantes bacterium]